MKMIYVVRNKSELTDLPNEGEEIGVAFEESPTGSLLVYEIDERPDGSVFIWGFG